VHCDPDLQQYASQDNHHFGRLCQQRRKDSGCLQIWRRRVGYRELILGNEQTRKFSGCWFAELESAEPISNAPETKQEIAATVASYIVLLPMRDENHVRRNLYYLVTQNREERKSNGEFQVPDINIEMHNYHQDEPQRQHPQPGSEHEADDDQSL
jgi:hypothetical protein